MPGNRFFAETWVNNAVGIGETVRIYLELQRRAGATGSLSLEVDFAAGTVGLWSFDSTAGGFGKVWSFPALRTQRGVWHIGGFIDTMADGASVFPTVQPRLTAPDGTHLVGAASTFTQPTTVQTESELRLVRLETTMATEGLQVCVGLPEIPGPVEFSQEGSWVKAAELDDPILPLTVIPQVSGSQWDAVSQIAKASMSTAEIDEHGRFRWRNFTRFRTAPTSPDLTLTSVREIAALTVTEEIDACRNYCVQPARDWSAVRLVQGDVVTDDRIREIPPYSTLTVTYPFDESEMDIGPPLTDDDSGIGGSRFRVAQQRATGTRPVKGMVDAMLRREEGSLVAQPLAAAVRGRRHRLCGSPGLPLAIRVALSGDGAGTAVPSGTRAVRHGRRPGRPPCVPDSRAGAAGVRRHAGTPRRSVAAGGAGLSPPPRRAAGSGPGACGGPAGRGARPRSGRPTRRTARAGGARVRGTRRGPDSPRRPASRRPPGTGARPWAPWRARRRVPPRHAGRRPPYARASPDLAPAPVPAARVLRLPAGTDAANAARSTPDDGFASERRWSKLYPLCARLCTECTESPPHGTRPGRRDGPVRRRPPPGRPPDAPVNAPGACAGAC